MSLLCTYGVLLLAWVQAGDAELARTPLDVESAIEQLGSARYELRQQATEYLWSVGEPALAALEKAASHRNREIRERASFVRVNIQQGIAFDTPREVLREVQRFRGGDQDAKRGALVALEAVPSPRIVLGLIEHEPDAEFRQELWPHLERALQNALRNGDDELVAATLREAATRPEWARHWIAYLAVRGQLDHEIARLEEGSFPAGTPERRDELLIQMWRAKGELQKARVLAEQLQARPQREAGSVAAPAESLPSDSSSPATSSALSDVVGDLVLEQRDWTAAARRIRERIAADPAAAEQDPEILGFAAAYHRLAGDSAAFERYSRQLIELAGKSQQTLKELDPRRRDAEKQLTDKQWYVAKALLLNGRYDDAVEVLRHHHPSFAFELLVHQQRYSAAFALAGVSDPSGFTQDWFEQVARETLAADEPARQRFALALHVVRQLRLLGSRPLADQGLAILGKATTSDVGTVRRRMVVDTAVKLGLRNLANEVGAVILEREGSPAVLSVLYPNRQAVATMWWEYFREGPSRGSVKETLQRIDQCLRLQPWTKDQFQELIPAVEARAMTLVEPKRSEWWNGVGETCLLFGMREEAVRCFEQAAVFSSSDCLRLGDFYAGEQRWELAADWYRRASEFEKTASLPMFLHAQALSKLGQLAAARRLEQVAAALPLGNDAARRELAAGLKQRGYLDDSLQQFELLARTAVPGEHDQIEALKQIGNAIHPQEELRAANCWEAMVLCCLRTKWGFADANGYTQIPFLVHKTRAKGFLKAGDGPSAAEEVRRAQVVSPASLELAEELLPELRKAGQLDEMERLFQQTFQANTQLCATFPNCATFHNNLAWLCGRQQRELDVALTHAQRAIELDPNNPAYLDTFGEVQFARGQFDEAIAYANRCVQLDPRSKHYQEQLARFNAAKASRNGAE